MEFTEGQLPRGAHYLDETQTNSINNRSSPPAVRPNEIRKYALNKMA